MAKLTNKKVEAVKFEHKLTSEQQDIVDTNLQLGDTMKIIAYSGCAKTTSLRAYTLARPDEKFLYLAYNTTVAADARGIFPKNVKCVTTHSLAFGFTGFKYQDKLGLIKPHVVLDCVEGVNKYPIAKFLADVINKFCASSDRQIEAQHLVLDKESSLDEFLSRKDIGTVKYLIDKAKNLWCQMCDPRNMKVPMTHDGYLKLFQMSNPKLDYDCILLDECHDTNNVVLDIFEKQSCSKILVGDKFQSCYGFRHAEDALGKCTANITKRLSTSFRFGSKIAGVANMLLENLRGETTKLIGFKSSDSLNDVDMDSPFTIVARTNGFLFDFAAQALTHSGASFGWVGTKEKDNWNPYVPYYFDRVLDVYRLFAEENHKIKDSYIKRFTSFASFMSIISDKDAPDLELLSRANVVMKHKYNVPKIVDSIIARSVNPSVAKINFVTAHKSKGLEWDQVVLGNDFAELVIPDENTGKPRIATEKDCDIQEFHLLYIAATRAKRVLQVNKSIAMLQNFLSHQPKKLEESVKLLGT